jgi:predicted ATP-dependent serine protease
VAVDPIAVPTRSFVKRSLANPIQAVVMGEIGLGGEVRPVPALGQRVREAAKLGFPSAFVPFSGSDKLKGNKHVPMKLMRGMLPMFAELGKRTA